MSDKIKILNIVALILLCVQATICLSLKKPKPTRAMWWRPNWWMKIEKGQPKIYESLSSCNKDCLNNECFGTHDWSDTRKYLSPDEGDFFCREKKNISPKFTDAVNLKFPEAAWNFLHICDSYCQALYGLRCVKANICKDNTCVDAWGC